MCLPTNINENISTNIQNYKYKHMYKNKTTRKNKKQEDSVVASVLASHCHPEHQHEQLVQFKEVAFSGQPDICFLFKVTIFSFVPTNHHHLGRSGSNGCGSKRPRWPLQQLLTLTITWKNITIFINKAGTEPFIIGFQSFFYGVCFWTMVWPRADKMNNLQIDFNQIVSQQRIHD